MPVVSQYFADEFWQMPRCEPINTEAVIMGLLQHKISHVLPSRDGELLFWAKLAPQLTANGIRLLLSPEPTVRLCLDKRQFSEWGERQGLPMIPSYQQPESDHSLWVVKERYGAGSTKLGLALTKDQARQHAIGLESPLFQPFIAGQEISIDAWLDNQSQLKGHICRYRIKVQQGESQITQSVRLTAYDQLIRNTLEGLGLTGPVVLQGIISDDQQLHLLECNSRFGGASTLGIRAGVDSLYWSLAESLGMDLGAIPFLPLSEPVTQIRYAGDLYL